MQYRFFTIIFFTVPLILLSWQTVSCERLNGFKCDFDICDNPNHTQYCNSDKRCAFCGDDESCLRQIPECAEECKKIQEHPTTTSVPSSTSDNHSKEREDDKEEGNSTKIDVILVLVILSIIAAVVAVVVYILYKKKKLCFEDGYDHLCNFSKKDSINKNCVISMNEPRIVKDEPPIPIEPPAVKAPILVVDDDYNHEKAKLLPAAEHSSPRTSRHQSPTEDLDQLQHRKEIDPYGISVHQASPGSKETDQTSLKTVS